MEDMQLTPSVHEFGAARRALQSYVDRELLAGASYALLEGRALVDASCVGWANRELDTPLRMDHLFRVYSNSKLVTSCAALLLFEEGRFKLDDAIEQYLPQLGARKVLMPGATNITQTEPARGPITIRHLMSHSAGLSYGVFDPGTPLYLAYNEREVLSPSRTTEEMLDVLAELPLAFHPGTAFEYSVATDVLGRLVEVLSGERLDAFFQRRIFGPLGMVDTSFVVPAEKKERLTVLYRGADPVDQYKQGLTPIDNYPNPSSYLQAKPRLSGGGGLVSSLPDMVALLRSLMPRGAMLLKPETVSLMMTNQLAPGVHVGLPQTGGPIPGWGHGLAAGIVMVPGAHVAPATQGEFGWGGVAGTRWWINPARNVAGVLMMQREMGFFSPAQLEFKRLVYKGHGLD